MLKTPLLQSLALVASLAVSQFAGDFSAHARGLSGSYLAASRAEAANDYQQAAKYYARALGLDPANPEILRGAMYAALGKGDMTTAHALATRQLQVEPTAVLPQLLQIIRSIETTRYDLALAQLDQTDGALGELLGKLLRGWVLYGLDDQTGAEQTFHSLSGNETLRDFGRLHLALTRYLSGHSEEALAELEGENAPVSLFALAYELRAALLAELGRPDEARLVLEDAIRTGLGNADVVAARDLLQAGGTPEFTQINSVSDGVAEILFELATVYQEENSSLPVIYARLGQSLRKEHPETALLISDLMEVRGQYTLANSALASIPREAPQFMDAEASRATVLERAGRMSEAIGILTSLTRIAPDDLDSHYLLAEALKRDQRFEEAIEAYNAAIALVPSPEPFMWRLYYGRAVAQERIDEWEPAEADFRRALELSPRQPQVLNYLGYSLLEKGEKLEEALGMVELALEERPDSAAIVDSLAWGLFLMGRVEEALPHQERAVELLPTDPIVNEHLGDIYWALGRHREARFQWRRALSFHPEADRIPKIKRKIENGLEPETSKDGRDEVSARSGR